MLAVAVCSNHVELVVCGLTVISSIVTRSGRVGDYMKVTIAAGDYRV